MINGTVKWFNERKGYGFIEPGNGEKDVFVHISALEPLKLRTLKDGQKVEFEITEENGKKSATNLKLI